MRLNPARVPVLFGLLAALLVVVLAGSALGLVWSMRTTAMRNAEGLVENMAMGVEATLNRHLLSLDLLLSGVQDQLQVTHANDRSDDGRLLTMISRDNLLVGRLLLLDAKGGVHAVSGSSGALQEFSLPCVLGRDHAVQGGAHAHQWTGAKFCLRPAGALFCPAPESGRHAVLGGGRGAARQVHRGGAG